MVNKLRVNLYLDLRLIFTLNIVEPQPTECEKQYEAAVKSESPDVFIPRCTNDGKFEKVQCQKSKCYCVDANGKRISGTSVSLAAGKPSCERPGW